MAGNLESAPVRFIHRRGELGAGDVHVCLERRRAGVRPECDEAARVGRVLQRVHLRERGRTIHIRRRGVDPGSHLSSSFDCRREVQVGVAADVAASAHRRDAAREIQPREAHVIGAVDARAGRVVEVLVHHYEARDHGLPREVHHLRALRHSGRAGSAEQGDVAVTDDQRLVFLGRGAGAIDDAHVGEGHHRRVDRDVWLDRGGERQSLGCGQCGQKEQGAKGAEGCPRHGVRLPPGSMPDQQRPVGPPRARACRGRSPPPPRHPPSAPTSRRTRPIGSR